MPNAKLSDFLVVGPLILATAAMFEPSKNMRVALGLLGALTVLYHLDATIKERAQLTEGVRNA